MMIAFFDSNAPVRLDQDTECRSTRRQLICCESERTMATALNNRRKVERISLGDNLYAVLDTTPQIMGQVVEISSTGLAFSFVDLGEASGRLSARPTLQLDLFEGGRGFFARGLNCRLVSEIEDDAASSLACFSIRRVGVAFEGLTLPQQVRINHLVRKYQAH
jgi:hypothetical protein